MFFVYYLYAHLIKFYLHFAGDVTITQPGISPNEHFSEPKGITFFTFNRTPLDFLLRVASQQHHFPPQQTIFWWILLL